MRFIKINDLKLTQFELFSFFHFMYVAENASDLKLTQVELFSFFHFMYVAANASELFCMAPLANIGRLIYHSKHSS